MEIIRKAVPTTMSSIQRLPYQLQFYHRSSNWNSFIPIFQPSAHPFAERISHSMTNAPAPGLTNLGLLGGIRTKITQVHYPKVEKEDSGGVKYHGFSWYPRPGEVDPPYEPTKLFMVKRTRSLRCKPWWDRMIMHSIGIKYGGDVAIIKNTPEQCKKLYKVKHLVEITPITFPNGFPTEKDSGFIKQNGEYVSYTQLSGSCKPINIEEDTKYLQSTMAKDKYLDKPTLKERLHKKWYSRWDII